jgi:hypothetical protein
MVGNEKLLAARAKIEAILKEYDIAGHVVLHCPGFIEVFRDMQPSYSKATITERDGGTEVRVRSKLADYNGDKDAQRRDLEATANLFASMAEALLYNAYGSAQMAAMVDEAMNAEHTGLQKLEPDAGGQARH